MPYVFSCVKGQQRNVEYFQANLDFGEVAQLVELPEDFLGDELFDQDLTMQRKISWPRVRKEMVPYLENDDAFYSALTLIMIPRDLNPLVEGEGYEFKAVGGNGGDIGHLTVKSTLVLFPADGQHRVASIKEAIKKHPELANVSMPVIFIPFRNRAAVRQLFSDLNLNAKPVNKSIGRSFETRDPVAVISKNAEKIVALFNDRVNHMSNSLAASSSNVITVNTLYEGTNALLRGLGYDVDALPEGDYPKVSQEIANTWTHIIKSLPGWANVTSGTETPNKLREEYVFAHGIGWQALAVAAAVMAEEGGPSWLPKLEATLKSIDWSKTNPDWQNVCMAGDRMNNTGPGVRATAGYILAKAGMTGDKAKTLINLYHKSIGEEASKAA